MPRRYNLKKDAPVEPLQGIADALTREPSSSIHTPVMSQEARILAYREAHPKATYEQIANATGILYWLVKRLLEKPRKSTKADQVRAFAQQHPQASPGTIAKRVGVGVQMVIRTLELGEDAHEIRDTNRRKPKTIEPLCSHDRARNRREHRDQTVYGCCLSGPPARYIAIAMPVSASKIIGMCPPLNLVVRAASIEELALEMRAAVDATLDIALHYGAFTPMPAPLEAPLPAQIWGIGLKPEVARRIYHRWREEPPKVELNSNLGGTAHPDSVMQKQMAQNPPIL